MFEHQSRDEVVGIETRFFWLVIVLLISFMCSTSLCYLSD